MLRSTALFERTYGELDCSDSLISEAKQCIIFFFSPLVVLSSDDEEGADLASGAVIQGRCPQDVVADQLEASDVEDIQVGKMCPFIMLVLYNSTETQLIEGCFL